MSEEPEFDLTAPLGPLRPGELPSGLSVEPVYYERGYDGALPVIWLRVQVLRRLLKALVEARRDGFGLLVWDGWRPPELQRTLWDEYRENLARATGLRGAELDDRARAFVSDPDGERIPAHVTGGAVDLTLCDASGRAVDMGGEFDELTDRSHPDYYEHGRLTPTEAEYRERRRTLLRVMSSAGFWRLPTEWWHFEWGTNSWAAAMGGTPRFGEAPPPPS